MPDEYEYVIRTPRHAGPYVFIDHGQPQHGRLFHAGPPTDVGICSFEALPTQLQLAECPGEPPILLGTQALVPVPAVEGDYWVFLGFSEDSRLRLQSVTRHIDGAWTPVRQAVLGRGTMAIDGADEQSVEYPERLFTHFAAFWNHTVLKLDGSKLYLCRAA